MNHPVLNAVPRAATSKGELNTLRKQGKIPAVIYGGGQAAEQILLDAKEFKQATSGISESTIISIHVGKEKKDAFVRERQREPLSISRQTPLERGRHGQGGDGGVDARRAYPGIIDALR